MDAATAAAPATVIVVIVVIVVKGIASEAHTIPVETNYPRGAGR